MFQERERRNRLLNEHRQFILAELKHIQEEESQIDRDCSEHELIAFTDMTFEEQTKIIERTDLTYRQSRAFQKAYVLHGSPALKHVPRDLVLKHADLFSDDDLRSLSHQDVHWVVCVFIFIQIVLAALGDITQRVEFAFAVLVMFVIYPCCCFVWFEFAARRFVRSVRAKDALLFA